MKDEPAAARLRFDLLGQRSKSDAPGVKSGYGLNQMLERPAESVESLNDQRVTCTQMCEGFCKSRSLRFAAISNVLKYFLAPRGSEGITLQF